MGGPEKPGHDELNGLTGDSFIGAPRLSNMSVGRPGMKLRDQGGMDE
jgi:hypothetical protein